MSNVSKDEWLITVASLTIMIDELEHFPYSHQGPFDSARQNEVCKNCIKRLMKIKERVNEHLRSAYPRT